ncbi:MAG: MoaD/ThiS family protein [Arcobacteraceae bacterium]|jgi:molybdopterin synthase sulfur carrier subunit|nr:MoaD/ThiS family protein [Arcobacteraceae bacterium]MDY0365059.1 MoaD/ThiS family protein [Arcobacteraceae bacterium]
MVRVEFLGPINKKSLELDITTLDELKVILQEDQEVASWLVNSAIAINDKLISSKDIDLNDGDKISILPPVCGG